MTVRKRLIWLMVGFCLLFLALCGRLFQLQVVRAAELTQRGVNQWTRSGIVSAKRGDITDRNGKLLVQSTTAYIVCANPRQVENPEGMARVLGEVLGLDEETVVKKVSDKTKSSVILKRQVPREDVNTLRDLKEREEYIRSGALKGLTFDEDTKRWYPMGDYLAQTLGITNVDSVGQSGLEQYYEDYLAGQPGKIVSEVDARARTLQDGERQYIPAVAGNTLRLTIDKEIQSFVEKALRQCIEVNEAAKVQAIVMDVNTGEVLAMSMKPDYDPNDPPRNDSETLQSLMRITAISDVYEPGSTFKMLTASAALDSGVTNPDDAFYCSGRITVDGDTIRCWGNPHGAETMKKAIQNSCNPVFVELALRLGTDRLYRYLRAFGLGTPTGIDLPGEASGILIGAPYVKNVDLARIGFGQSVAVTPLQMITAACAVVNGGRLMRPYIVKEVLDEDGNVVERTQPHVVSTPISAETSGVMRELLESVVAEGGGKNAQVEGYRIGGKTGTAQVYKDGKIVRNVHIGSFVGFAPADDPRFAVIVIVDEASVFVDYGGTTAAPFAKQIMQETLEYMGVMPYDTQPKQQVKVPEARGMTVREAKALLSDVGLEALVDGEDDTVLGQMPLPGATMTEGSIVMLYVTEGTPPDAQDLVLVPDVLGKPIVEASRLLRARELELLIEGSGLAARQKPAAGTYVEPGTQVTVTFEIP